MTNLFLVTLGIFIFILALFVEIRHKAIWQNSLSNYKRPNSKILHTLIHPSKASYKINIYFLWPLVAMTGVWFICEGFNYTNLISIKTGI